MVDFESLGAFWGPRAPDADLAPIRLRWQAWKHEKYLIDVLPNLVNKTKGGAGWGGGSPATPERKRKIGAANRGRVLTDEHKAKLSAAKRGKKASPEAVNARAAGCRRAISIEKDGAVLVFKSLNECAAFLGVHQSCVSNLRTGKALTCKGYKLSQ